VNPLFVNFTLVLAHSLIIVRVARDRRPSRKK
jgi:hypothetical protein